MPNSLMRSLTQERHGYNMNVHTYTHIDTRVYVCVYETLTSHVCIQA